MDSKAQMETKQHTVESDAEFGQLIMRTLQTHVDRLLAGVKLPSREIDLALPFHIRLTPRGDRYEVCCVCTRESTGIVVCRGSGSKPCC